MGHFFRLVTRWTPEKIEQIESQLAGQEINPRDVKMDLAKEVVSIYHGEENAEHAESEFRTVFQKQGLPEDIPEYPVSGEISLVNLIAEAKLVSSKSEARRMIQQGAVRIDDLLIEDIHATIQVESPQILRVGKRRFLRLIAGEGG
jgi:tyrosyl-tRNA synthetase